MSHDVNVVPAQKMDTPRGLFQAVCGGCDYRSGPLGLTAARLAGQQHKAAKEAADETPMTESEIRAFIDEATEVTGDRVTVTDRILRRWLADRANAEQAAKDGVYDEFRDGWYGLSEG